MKLYTFPEGIMTLESWTLTHAVRVEGYQEVVSSYYSRTTFNRLEGREQDEYMAKLRAKAAKPHFRAWSDRDTFYSIPASLYAKAVKHGIPAPNNDLNG